MPAAFQPALLERDRLGRRVLRSHLRLPSQDASFRATFALEEALRFAELPGESEGRIYFFQRVDLPAISAQASRAVWMERIQASLEMHAAPAIHGSHPSALSANAVYFHNLEEGLEILLGQSLRSNAEPPWFAASMLGLAGQAVAPLSSDSLAAAIVARLRPPAMPLAVASSIVIAALGTLPPSSLLDKLPEAFVRDWLHDFEATERALPMAVSAIALSTTAENHLRQAAEHYGWCQPSTLLLAALVVIDATPSLACSTCLLQRVRATLRLLEQIPQERSLLEDEHCIDKAAGESTLAADDTASPDDKTVSKLASETVALEEKYHSSLQAISLNEISTTRQSATADVQLTKVAVPIDPAPQSAPSYLLGDATQFAGLYFLLHVLRRIGIAAAVDTCPALAEAGLPTHILLQLAMRFGIPFSDPILAPMGIVESVFSLDADTLAELPSAAYPNNLPLSTRATSNREFLRLWTHAVRRWCWVNARISVGSMLVRPGCVWQSRTDLDVTLSMEAVDTCIRRAGLDLDPLWLPWFGDYGRVVRFHYKRGTDLGEST